MRLVFVLVLLAGLSFSPRAFADADTSLYILPERSHDNQMKMKVDKRPLLERYYAHSGHSMITFLGFGYSTYFLMPGLNVNTTRYFGKRHILNFEIFEWRARLFGMSIFNFEMGVNTPHAYPGDVLSFYQRGGKEKTDVVKAEGNTMWFAYKPAIKAYIPIEKWCAAVVYGGISVDLTRMWSSISSSYYKDYPEVPKQNYFLGVYGGVGFMFTPVAYLPIEIKAEYRHPLSGNIALVPQGFYLSAQLHIGNPVRKNSTNQDTETYSATNKNKLSR